MKKIRKLSNTEVAAFCEELSLLICSGITPLEALGFMKDDSVSAEGAQILQTIQQGIVKGELFYEAIASTSLFPEYMIEMIRLGEETGNLDSVVKNLAAYYQQQNEIRDEIKNALTYPCIMIILMLSIIMILLMKILPIFEHVFMELGTELSGFAKSLLQAGKHLQTCSTVFLFTIIILIILLYLICKTKKGKQFFLHILYTAKISKTFFLEISYSRFAACFAMIQASGINIFVGLDMISELLHHEIMTEKITVCKKALSENEYIYDALQSAGFFKPSQLRLLQIAYKTGNAEEELTKISHFYEEKVLSKVQKILEVVEPTLVIIFSVIVGIILLSVIFPLIGVMSNIG